MFPARATTDPNTTASAAVTSIDGLLADVTRSSRDGIAVVLDGQIEWVNGPLVVLLGIPANELVGRRLAGLELELLGSGGTGGRLDLNTLGDGNQVTGNLLIAEGSPVPVSVEATSLGVPGDGRRAVTFRRITPLVRAQAEVREAEARFEAVSTFTPVGVFHAGQGVRLDFVNLRFAELWRARPEELTGTGWLARIHADDQADVFAMLERTLAGTPSTCTLRVIGSPATYLRIRTVPVVRADRSMGFVGSVDETVDPVETGRQADIRTGLRSAIAASSVRLAYQPIVSTTTGMTVGVEALLRYRHTRHGDIPATEAVGIVEASDDIIELGRLVLTSACRDLAHWRGGSEHAPGYVAVNVSALQLADPTFAAYVRSELARFGLIGSDLCLELTESQVMADPASAVATLAALRAHGVRVALDDFGTGHSSLAYLRDLPVDVVKLDRSYVTAIESAPAATVVRAVTALAAALGCDVVAEGIETRAQLHWARDLGCAFAQGYALGRPTPFADFPLELS